MLRSSITENKEYADDDIIDFNDINLEQEFDKLNKLLFDNKCNRVPLELSMRRMAHGHVSATINRLSRKITVKKLAISKFYNIPYKLFKDTFAHEMIHVYLLQQNINDGHGVYFHREMNRINGMGLGFNVSVKLDSGDLELSSSVKGRDVIFMIFSNGGKIGLSVMTPTAYYSQGVKIGKIFSYATRSGKYKEFVGEFYESNNPLLRKFTIQRSFTKSISHSTITEDMMDKLISESKKISEVYTNGNEIIWQGTKPNGV